MKFFSENAEQIDSGLFGIAVSLNFPEMDAPSGFGSYVQPFLHECGLCKTAFDLVFISQTTAPFGVYCGVHGHLESGKLTQLALTLNRKPSSEPPSELAETDRKLGGYTDGRERFFRLLGDPVVTCRARLLAAIIGQKPWVLPFKKRKKPTALGDFEIEREEIMLTRKESDTRCAMRFHKGIGGCEVEIKGECELKISLECFENVADLLWQRVQTMIHPLK